MQPIAAEYEQANPNWRLPRGTYTKYPGTSSSPCICLRHHHSRPTHAIASSKQGKALAVMST